MTYAPASITAAAKVWTSHGGLNAGIVGSVRTHCRGYHLGKDRIYSQCACQPKVGVCQAGQYGSDYSMTLPRDRNGATNGAAALDLGPVKGAYGPLRQFSRWLVDQCRNSTADTDDIRELIYSPDGSSVWEWLRDRGEGSAPLRITHPTAGDLTHLRHTHISYYRDTEFRDKTRVFKRYFGVPPTPPTPQPPEDDMPITKGKAEDWRTNASTDPAVGRPIRATPDRAKGKIIGYLKPPHTIRTVAEALNDDNWRLSFAPDGTAWWFIRSDLEPLVQGGDPAVDAEYHTFIQEGSS